MSAVEQKATRSLAWDGTPRIDRGFVDCEGADDTMHVRAAALGDDYDDEDDEDDYEVRSQTR